MNRLLSADSLAEILATSRTKENKSQQFMAKALGKSIGTIQNWEKGYATPNLFDTLQWFEVLGLNPLRYILDFVYPSVYYSLSADNSDDEIDAALSFYFKNVATSTEKRKLAFCIFGNTGSSWSSQLDLLTAHNHTTLRSRVNAAQVIMDSYDMEKARHELTGLDHVMPNEESLRTAIIHGKQSVINGKQGY